MAPDARNKKSVIEYMDNFWFDLDVHTSSLRKAVIDIVGVDRIVHGTNFGGAYDFGDPTEGLELSDADTAKIHYENATSLLSL